MSAEENKAIIRRFVEDVWNQANLAAAEELLAADALAPGGRVVGPQAVRDATIRNAVARPDLHYTIEDLIAEGDRVVVRWTGRGTHRGAWDHPVFGHLAPTGNVVTSTGVNIFRLAGGKIVERWDVRDELGVGQQLGVIPPPDHSPAVLEANKAVVRRLARDVWNRGNLDAIDELFTPDFRWHGEVVGPSGVKALLARLTAEQPDVQVTIEDLVAEGDKVVVRSTRRGTYLGPPAEDPLLARLLP
jgi:predicted ester cyclase